ncbi:MAG: AAA family ATPase, partial [Microbacterium sp.]|nr:AAA family ATPase [Microbacterium sp.]
VASLGVAADRDRLAALADEVAGHAARHHVTGLLDGDTPLGHVKAFMAADTATMKTELEARLVGLAAPGRQPSRDRVAKIAARVLEDTVTMNAGQADAAAAIASTDRLVTVTGPAGTGKTTLLRVAAADLAAQRRRLVLVAPTKKAASVAGRETGAAASSLHALLADHGWRWGHGAASEEVWMRLAIGEADPTTGVVYGGPHRFVLEAGDRIVVDEAGMVDLHTANALAVLAAETDAGLAMVGDHLQAMPVGHSGAMASLTRRATAVVELTSVHRFHDPEYAALSLRLREPGSRADALEVAAELDRRGLVRRVADASDARDAMVDAFFEWSGQHKRVALVTGTNEEADAINEAIQQRRVDAGQLSLHRIAVGQGEQRLLEGDIVQTRRNDRHAGVENRALWVIGHITGEDIELESVTDERDVRRVSHDYAGEHMHLAYASTVHGIQGETTDASLVGPGVGASGLYVGMTRGRVRNEVVAIARTDTAAREQIADAMARGIPEVSIGDSIRAARTELGRAAQDPNPTSPPTVRDAPRWDDRARRPFGAEPRLERVLAKTSERLARARLLSASYSSFMGEAGPTLLRLASIIATSEARLHARGPVPSEDAVASSQQ